MEVKVDKHNVIKFSHKLKRGETYKINKGRKYSNISIYQKPSVLKGVASYCQDGKHVLFIDYDNCPLWLVREDYKRLQAKYGLPTAYLFTTKERVEEKEKIGNYHVICLAKFYPNKIYEMISKTHADVNFMSMPLRNKYRNWILRIGNKKNRARPKYVGIIGSLINYDKEISKAHLDLLNKLHKLPELPYENIDDLNKIYLQEYETLNA